MILLNLSGSCLCEKDLIGFLNQVKSNTEINFITLFNDEGFLLASAASRELIGQPDFYQDFAALSSGILTMAQSMVKITNPENLVTKISIQGGEEQEPNCFGLILLSLSNEVHLVACYPLTCNYGILLIEIRKIAESLKEYLDKVQNL